MQKEEKNNTIERKVRLVSNTHTDKTDNTVRNIVNKILQFTENNV